MSRFVSVLVVWHASGFAPWLAGFRSGAGRRLATVGSEEEFPHEKILKGRREDSSAGKVLQGCTVYFDSRSKEFDEMTREASFEVLAEGEIGAHEAAIFVEDEVKGNSLIFTTKPYAKREAFFADIKSLKVDGPEKGKVDVVHSSCNLVNGGTIGTDGRLYFCFQGRRLGTTNLDDDDDDGFFWYHPAGIYSVDPTNWSDWRATVDEKGPRFNSPNDVAARTTDGSLWFTDPSYAHAQGFAPPPELGDWVWRLDAKTGRLNVVADGFHKPNGVCFSVDQSILYVTDTGTMTGVDRDPKLPRSIYAFDVLNDRLLGNRRLVYVADSGIPDGIKVDGSDRIYTGCADGVHVVDPSSGDLLGKIRIQSEGGAAAANLCFGTVEHSDEKNKSCCDDDRNNAQHGASDSLSRCTLYILAETAVIAVHLNTEAPIPRPPREN